MHHIKIQDATSTSIKTTSSTTPLSTLPGRPTRPSRPTRPTKPSHQLVKWPSFQNKNEEEEEEDDEKQQYFVGVKPPKDPRPSLTTK